MTLACGACCLQREGYFLQLRDGQLDCVFSAPFFSSYLIGLDTLCIVAHDDRGVEYPARCMRKPLWFTVQGGRCVVWCVEEHHFVLKFIIVKSKLNRYSPSCPPRGYNSIHGAWSGKGNTIRERAKGKRGALTRSICLPRKRRPTRTRETGSVTIFIESGLESGRL